jgi:DNA-binding CsgD family transcriptional regulator
MLALTSEFSSIVDAESRDDFRDQVFSFASDRGFTTVSAMTVVDRISGEPEFIVVENIPDEYKQDFYKRDSHRIDPVMQHCKRRGIPIVWNRSTYTAHGLDDRWAMLANFGLCTGIAVALHLPNGRHFFLGVERAKALPASIVDLTRLVADIQLFAVHANEAAERLLIPADTATIARPKLTPREIQALEWTMVGKTAWELGRILSISERTAVLHITNAMRKLGCCSKHQAVLRALKLGIIK